MTNKISVGTELSPLRVDAVRRDDIKLMALILRDPNPIHFDLDAVAEAGLGDRAVNQGGATMAYVMNLLTGWAGSRAAIQRIRCEFRGYVFAGDDVEVGGRVTSTRATDAGTVAEVDVWADVIGGRRAVLGSATVLIRDETP